MQGKKLRFKKIQKAIERNENKIRTVAALAFLVVSTIIIIVIYSSLISSLETVGYVIPEPRNVTIPLHMNLNGTRSYDVDVSFTFDVTYHNGTLIVDEPVDVDGVAVFVSKNAKEIETIQVGFQNFPMQKSKSVPNYLFHVFTHQIRHASNLKNHDFHNKYEKFLNCPLFCPLSTYYIVENKLARDMLTVSSVPVLPFVLGNFKVFSNSSLSDGLVMNR